MPPPPLDAYELQVLRIWVEMGRCIDYTALPWLMERHGVQDAEALVDLLLVVRDTRGEVQ